MNKVEIDFKQAVSEYAMAFDLLAQVTHSSTEKEAIENILQIFNTLFSPQKLFYLSMQDGQPEQIYSLSLLADEKSEIKTRLSNFNQKYAWTESEKGFRVQINYKNNTIGILEVDEIAHPEYKERYLNLTISMADVYGLAIENAIRYQRIKAAENRALNEKIKLEEAMAEIKQLSGLLPICAHCKKIRDDKGYWNNIESYVQQHSEAKFSHSMCTECSDELYGNEDWYVDMKKEESQKK
ncbi:hypothetical protein KAJ27_10735 [bacterium]|nr:hypothetical protein [bacterium]